MKIKQSSLTPELKSQILEAFGAHARHTTGLNGLAEDPISFEIHENNLSLGCVVVQLYWGELHIKFLFVNEHHRTQGIGTKLMEHALKFGKSRGCHFTFVETMSFQAPEFYQKLGFRTDFVRSGYAKETSLYYLSKNLCS